jgi:hypothetical protein
MTTPAIPDDPRVPDPDEPMPDDPQTPSPDEVPAVGPAVDKPDHEPNEPRPGVPYGTP